MSRIIVDQEIFEQAAENILKSGNILRFRANGNSMVPSIRDGEYVLIEPVDFSKIRKGDILFCRNNDDKLVAHTVIQVNFQEDKEKVLLKGDNSFHSDGWLSSSQILGKLTQVERRGRIYQLESRLYRIKMNLLRQPFVQRFRSFFQ
jgi:signal peptidase I